ncbi:unnamed protein product [Cylindrotheca closterium]|uniref:Nudix hydrolase domain-containing protein n=1 Tax=Cylindrotheca closterium TaxID=2856 RepID=A0AAD2FJ37_9STRA|nr:unnamed protein product [Cylindrotheca closterium]
MRLSTIATRISFILPTSTVLSWIPQRTSPKINRLQSCRSQRLSVLHSTPPPATSTSASADDSSISMGTLASDFRIAISSSVDTLSWSLYPLNGMPAKDALSTPPLGDAAASWTITCQPTESKSLGVEVSNSDATVSLEKDLITVLQIVLFQSFLKEHPASNEEWHVGIDENHSLKVSDILAGDGVETLFSSLKDNTSSVEWVDMVTGSGKVLGRVPRPLVHKYNLLHRGIGMFVTKDKAMVEDSQYAFPPLYTHQRTATKRIFPSLYDMFVGGVSLAGESSDLTARREVAEELGLSLALECPEALSDPILDCLVCTHLNRCFVTLYSYTMNTEKETVSWQEEEVAWGDFVAYPIIAAAADLSIKRLEKQKSWPGIYPAIQSDLNGVAPKDISYENGDWNQWDFVPDGLLVWEAWLLQLQNKI